jgi:hypothetical protein
MMSLPQLTRAIRISDAVAAFPAGKLQHMKAGEIGVVATSPGAQSAWRDV